MKVAVFAHGHPDQSPGGAEIAAYSLFDALKARRPTDEFLFVARTTTELPTQPFSSWRSRADELLITAPECDYFFHSTKDSSHLDRTIDAIVTYFDPDIVNIHHFVHIGIEILEMLRRRGVKIVVTFHEYLAICCHHGQMVTRNNNLCSNPAPDACAQCFPPFAAWHFQARKKFIQTYLAFADHFVAPSHFLAERYVSWGLPEVKLTVVENPFSPQKQRAANNYRKATRTLSGGDGKVKVGYFGQFTPFKGLHVIFEALALLTLEQRERLSFGLHGGKMAALEASYRVRLESLSPELSDILYDFGPFPNDSVFELMQNYDWIIVPSVWWENSPVVVQEALAIGKPIICSGIGGLAEKAARDPRTIFFEPGDAKDLARKLAALNSPPDDVNLIPTQKLSDPVKAYEELFRSLL